MRICLIVVISLIISVSSFSQEKNSKKVIVTLSDTANIELKVKKAFAKNNLIVKEYIDSDTLSSFPSEQNGLYTIVYAEIKDSNVILFGLYGLKRLDSFGYSHAANSYKRILYYKASKSWSVLMKVARSLGGEIYYLK